MTATTRQAPIDADVDPGPQPTSPRPATFGGGTVMQAAVAVAGAGNILFHVAATRQLEEGSYGNLAAANTILAALITVMAAVQMAAARAVAHHHHGLALARLFSRLTLAGAALLVLVAPIAGTAGDFLAVGGRGPMLLIAGWVLVELLLAATKGVLLAEERHHPLAAALVVGAAVRAGLAWPACALWGVSGALVVSVAGEAVTVALLAPVLRGRWRGPAQLTVPVRDVAGVALTEMGLWALPMAATVLAARELTGDGASGFGLAMTLGTAALFLPSARAAIAFPQMCVAADTAPMWALFRWCATYAAVCVAGATVAGPLVIPAVFGEAVTASTLTLAVVVTGCGALGLAQVCAAWLRAKHQRGSELAWVGAVTVVAVGSLLGTSPLALAATFTGATVAVTVGLAAFARLGATARS